MVMHKKAIRWLCVLLAAVLLCTDVPVQTVSAQSSSEIRKQIEKLEQQEQALLDRLNTVLEGEPAKLGKARVCRTALGTLTQSQWLEYKRIAAVSGEAANAWVKERGYLSALLPGDEVVVLEIDQKLGAAKVATLTGQVVWMTYACLIAAE